MASIKQDSASAMIVQAGILAGCAVLAYRWYACFEKINCEFFSIFFVKTSVSCNTFNKFIFNLFIIN